MVFYNFSKKNPRTHTNVEYCGSSGEAVEEARHDLTNRRDNTQEGVMPLPVFAKH